MGSTFEIAIYRRPYVVHGDPKHGDVPRARRAPDDWADYAIALGIQLHRRRVEMGLSQEQLAYAAGLSRYTYQKFEAGLSAPGTPSNPSLRNVMALAQVLGVSLDELLPDAWPELRAGATSA
jgi:DNA-binding XRE family transcriptional regulator